MKHHNRAEAIAAIRALPAQLEALVADLSAHQLTTPFLAGEWSVAQNIHHLADSHMNSYIRFKLILTEDNPTVRPYDQDAWALTPEANDPDLSASMTLLRGLHARWATMLDRLPDDAWNRTGFHPGNGTVVLHELVHTYAEHGLGHIDQIQRMLAAQPELAHADA